MTYRLPLRLALIGLFLAFPFAAASAQDALQNAYDEAYFAWDAGHYPEALEGFLALLERPGGDRFLKDIALLTGEWFVVEEIAPNGGGLQWHPNGRNAAYESDGLLHLIGVQNGQVRAQGQLPGRSLVFSPTRNEAAFLRIDETAELARARAQRDSLLAARDFQGFFRERQEVANLEASLASIWVRNLDTQADRPIAAEGISKTALVYSADGETLYLIGPSPENNRPYLYAIREGAAPQPLTDVPGQNPTLVAVPGGRYLLFSLPRQNFALYDLRSGEITPMQGDAPAISQDGSTLAFVTAENGEYGLSVMDLAGDGSVKALVRGNQMLTNPTLSADGQQVAYQAQMREDWDLFVVQRHAPDEPQRVTRDIQHDLFPQFLSDTQLLGVIGEGRHRRSYLYDLTEGTRTRLFHNNTLRTVAPEYQWAASPDGRRILVVSERDGDTITPERGVYLIDLTRTHTKASIVARLQENLQAERRLREAGQATYAPVRATVEGVVDHVSVGRIYHYAEDLYQFDSKFITQPGNRKAIDYLAAKLRSFGYEPELQWFEPRPGVETANVIATLRGTTNPELVYVISSHFDSVQRGPGADDNSSGTSALLEAARVLAQHPMPATIQFAFFTGEEAGLLGSREFVRRAVESGVQITGALNNDMVGWTRSHRLDNTIRYSNEGIRDIQHAAAMLFTNLITYDAKYYKGTDAHAYYEAYGDIVGGIGSYPILGNPHYHQPHDYLETINQPLVAEVSKTTVATIMLLAASPARLKGLTVTRRRGNSVDVHWDAAPEAGVVAYEVVYGTGENRKTKTTSEPRINLSDAPPGTSIHVKAVLETGLKSWDWAKVIAE